MIFYKHLGDKVFKNGSSKICGRQPLKDCLSRPYSFKFFKGCLPQVLLGPFLNICSIYVYRSHLNFSLENMSLLLITVLFSKVKEQFLPAITAVSYMSNFSHFFLFLFFFFFLHFINHIALLVITEFLILSFLVLTLI